MRPFVQAWAQSRTCPRPRGCLIALVLCSSSRHARSNMCITRDIQNLAAIEGPVHEMLQVLPGLPTSQHRGPAVSHVWIRHDFVPLCSSCGRITDWSAADGEGVGFAQVLVDCHGSQSSHDVGGMQERRRRHHYRTQHMPYPPAVDFCLNSVGTLSEAAPMRRMVSHEMCCPLAQCIDSTRSGEAVARRAPKHNIVGFEFPHVSLGNARSMFARSLFGGAPHVAGRRCHDCAVSRCAPAFLHSSQSCGLVMHATIARVPTHQ